MEISFFSFFFKYCEHNKMRHCVDYKKWKSTLLYEKHCEHEKIETCDIVSFVYKKKRERERERENIETFSSFTFSIHDNVHE